MIGPEGKTCWVIMGIRNFETAAALLVPVKAQAMGSGLSVLALIKASPVGIAELTRESPA